MVRRRLIRVGWLLLAAVVCGCPSPRASAPSPEEALKAQAAEYRRALLADDFDRAAELTYAKAFRVGEKPKIAALLKSSAADLRDEGLRVKDIILSDPLPTREAGGVMYAVVPMTVRTADDAGGSGEVSSYLLAVSADGGKNWRFLNGTAVGPTRQLLEAWVPDLPKDLPFPERLMSTWNPGANGGRQKPPPRLAWLSNLDTALAQARDEKRLVFLCFLGVTDTNSHLDEKNVLENRRTRDVLRRYVLVKLYTDIVPADFYPAEVPRDKQQKDAEANQALQAERFGTVAAPMYLILKPTGPGEFEVVGKHEGRLIADPPEKVLEFLNKPLEGGQ